MYNKIGYLHVKTLLSILIAIVLIVGGIIAINHFFSSDREIILSADAYSLMKPYSEGDRTVVRIDDKKQVERINKILSGKYREGKRLAEIDDSSKDFVCIVVPIYKTDDYKKIDSYSENAFHEDTDEGHIIYSEGISILNDKNISFWDGNDEKEYWTGKKTDSKIDIDFLKSLMEIEQSPTQD